MAILYLDGREETELLEEDGRLLTLLPDGDEGGGSPTYTREYIVYCSTL